MKKHIAFIIICQFFLTNYLSAQITDSIVNGHYTNYYNPKGEVVKTIYRKFSKNGVLIRLSINNFEGSEKGIEVNKEYFQSGKLNSVFIRKQNMKIQSEFEMHYDDSLLIFYNEDGTMSSEYKYLNGKIYEATQYVWINNGSGKTFLWQKCIRSDYNGKKPLSTIVYNFTNKGQLLSKYISYRKKVLQIEIHFKDGQVLTKPEIINGDCKFTFCNADGKLCCECEYKNGKVIHCHPIK